MDKTGEELAKYPAPLKSAKGILTHKEAFKKSKIEAPDVERAGCLVKRAVNVIIAKNEFTKSLAAFSIAWKETKEGNFSFTVYLDFDNPFNIYKNRYAKFERLPNFVYIIKNDFKGRFKYLDGINPKDKACPKFCVYVSAGA